MCLSVSIGQYRGAADRGQRPEPAQVAAPLTACLAVLAGWFSGVGTHSTLQDDTPANEFSDGGRGRIWVVNLRVIPPELATIMMTAVGDKVSQPDRLSARLLLAA